MAIKYKIDIVKELKDLGYTTYRIRKEKLLSESTMQKFRAGDTSIALNNISVICSLLNCQPGDILEYVED